ncbi:MAG: hypothetical protein QGI60_02450 [archaeon]|nr:hypothetical protein [archaeon]
MNGKSLLVGLLILAIALSGCVEPDEEIVEDTFITNADISELCGPDWYAWTTDLDQCEKQLPCEGKTVNLKAYTTGGSIMKDSIHIFQYIDEAITYEEMRAVKTYAFHLKLTDTNSITDALRNWDPILPIHSGQQVETRNMSTPTKIYAKNVLIKGRSVHNLPMGSTWGDKPQCMRTIELYTTSEDIEFKKA